jgi:hypothetical protein
MHEARVAQSIVGEILDRGLQSYSLRVVVSGGHGDRAAFDEALRVQLAAALPTLDVGGVEIVHRPAAQLCGGCGGAFIAEHGTRCPMCGGEGVAVPVPEHVILEWGET